MLCETTFRQLKVLSLKIEKGSQCLLCVAYVFVFFSFFLFVLRTNFHSIEAKTTHFVFCITLYFCMNRQEVCSFWRISIVGDKCKTNFQQNLLRQLLLGLEFTASGKNQQNGIYVRTYIKHNLMLSNRVLWCVKNHSAKTSFFVRFIFEEKKQ